MPNGTDDATNFPNLTELHELQSATVWDAEGYKLGKVSQVFQDPAGHPQWVGVALGLFNSSEKIIPLIGARRGEGAYAEDLHVAYTKEKIENAPDVAEPTLLSPEDEDALNRHYAG